MCCFDIVRARTFITMGRASACLGLKHLCSRPARGDSEVNSFRPKPEERASVTSNNLCPYPTKIAVVQPSDTYSQSSAHFCSSIRPPLEPSRKPATVATNKLASANSLLALLIKSRSSMVIDPAAVHAAHRSKTLVSDAEYILLIIMRNKICFTASWSEVSADKMPHAVSHSRVRSATSPCRMTGPWRVLCRKAYRISSSARISSRTTSMVSRGYYCYHHAR